MRTRFRTLLLAGAASLAVSAAAFAQVTTNGAVSTISQIVQVVWNGQNISSSNPLPVAVASGGGGSATAAGTNGTTAQAVQGINGGVPLPIQGGNATAVKTDGSATTQPISAAALPLPAGAATSANQTSEIAQLTAANQRSALFADFTNQAVASSGTITGPWRDAGASPSPYTKFNYAFVSSQSGTAVVQVSNDGTNSLTNIMTTTALSPTNNIVGTLPLTYRYYRVVLINGTTAANASVNTAFATN
ncbi:hypothetical protein [uncultured Variovorax sp.]|uniref:hypothetical protein n=1 Tax=uncultured Variovorax sp. TaxID=114708 RepID=UPI0026026F0F|nr:hypothetical protein [uncultured Variovorax sp.]